MLYRNTNGLLYILALRFVLFLSTTAVRQFVTKEYVMLCYETFSQTETPVEIQALWHETSSDIQDWVETRRNMTCTSVSRHTTVIASMINYNYVVFCSLAVHDPRIGHTVDVLSPFISVLCHPDWLFHGESCPLLDVFHLGRARSSSPACNYTFWKFGLSSNDTYYYCYY